MSRPRTLSHRIEAIEYVHAADGLPYRHDFERGDSDIELRKDGSVLVKNKGRRLWDVFTVNGKAQPFLVNPRGTRDTPTRRKAAMAKRRSTKRRRNPTTARRRNAPRKKQRRTRRRTNGYASTYALAANPPKRRSSRRRHYRNPPFSASGILKQLTGGLFDGALVVGGKTIARLVSSQFPYQDGSMMDSGVELATALALAMMAPRFLGADRARFLAAGAFASPLETLASQANIPRVSSLLGKTKMMGDNTSAIFAAADSDANAPIDMVRRGVFGPGAGSQLSGYAAGGNAVGRPPLSPGAVLRGYPARAAQGMQS